MMRDVFRTRDFSLIWIAGLISVAGDFAFVVALPIHIYKLTDSTLATAGAFAVSVVPGIVLGSIAGVLVDRWDRKRTMIWADLGRAGLLSLLLIPGAADRLWVIYLVSVGVGSIGQFFGPAENAIVPRLVKPDQLATANALNSLNNDLGRLAGPALGAALYAASSLGGVALVDAISYLGSAFCIAAVAADGRPLVAVAVQSGGALLRRMATEWREGMTIMRRHRGLAVLVLQTTFAGMSEGFFISLALAPLILNVLGGTDAQVGWITSAQAVGGIIAGIVVARAAHRFAPRWLLIAGMIGLGSADLGFFNANRFAGTGTNAVLIAMFFMMLAGFPAVAGGTGVTTLVQMWTEDAYRGRVFGARRAIDGLATLIGLGIAGVLGDQIGIQTTVMFGSVLWIVGGFVMLALLPEPKTYRQELVEPGLAAGRLSQTPDDGVV
jgi:MFS family permease